jgi:hypothetical protein
MEHEVLPLSEAASLMFLNMTAGDWAEALRCPYVPSSEIFHLSIILLGQK